MSRLSPEEVALMNLQAKRLGGQRKQLKRQLANQQKAALENAVKALIGKGANASFT